MTGNSSNGSSLARRSPRLATRAPSEAPKEPLDKERSPLLTKRLNENILPEGQIKRQKIDNTASLFAVVKEEIKTEAGKSRPPQSGCITKSSPVNSPPSNPGGIFYAPEIPKKKFDTENILPLQSKFSSQPKALRWCRYEMFYSVADDIYFHRHNEFVELLQHCKLPSEPQSKAKWRITKKKLGSPKRFSKNFLNQERNKLHQFRCNLLRVQSGQAAPFDNAKKLFPSLPVTDQSVLAFDEQAKLIIKAQYKELTSTLFFRVTTTEGKDLVLPENYVYPLATLPTPPLPLPKPIAEKDPLETLAFAATVSPRHNGDVRTLKAVLKLLKKQDHLINSMKFMHDQAEKAPTCLTPEFKQRYARIVLEMSQLKESLMKELLLLRKSQEKSPYRCLPKRLPSIKTESI